MSNPNAEIIGKPVKDMYGSLVGTTVGTLTDAMASKRNGIYKCDPI